MGAGREEEPRLSYLREAFVWLQEQLDDPDDGPVGESVLRMIASSNPLRSGGEQLGRKSSTGRTSSTSRLF